MRSSIFIIPLFVRKITQKCRKDWNENNFHDNHMFCPQKIDLGTLPLEGVSSGANFRWNISQGVTLQ